MCRCGCPLTIAPPPVAASARAIPVISFRPAAAALSVMMVLGCTLAATWFAILTVVASIRGLLLEAAASALHVSVTSLSSSLAAPVSASSPRARYARMGARCRAGWARAAVTLSVVRQRRQVHDGSGVGWRRSGGQVRRHGAACTAHASVGAAADAAEASVGATAVGASGEEGDGQCDSARPPRCSRRSRRGPAAGSTGHSSNSFAPSPSSSPSTSSSSPPSAQAAPAPHAAAAPADEEEAAPAPPAQLALPSPYSGPGAAEPSTRWRHARPSPPPTAPLSGHNHETHLQRTAAHSPAKLLRQPFGAPGKHNVPCAAGAR